LCSRLRFSIYSASARASRRSVPMATLEKWRWEDDGTVTGSIHGKEGYRNGTLYTTSFVPAKGRFEEHIRTSSGSTYRLGTPDTGRSPSMAVRVVETRDHSRELAKRQRLLEVELRCPICWDSPPEMPSETPCGHVFCRSCIMAALQHKKECPSCRASVASHRLLQSQTFSRQPDAENPVAPLTTTQLTRRSASTAATVPAVQPAEACEESSTASAPGPSNLGRSCGTPGCFLPAFHAGPCVPEAMWSPRKRTAPERLQPQLTMARRPTARQPTVRADLNDTSGTGGWRRAPPSAITQKGTNDSSAAAEGCSANAARIRSHQKPPVATTSVGARHGVTMEKKDEDPKVGGVPKVPARVAAMAAAEGLTLVRSLHNTTGFKHVSHNISEYLHSKPFQLRVTNAGKVQNWGYFATADEAALAYARRIGPDASAAEEAASVQHMMTAAEAFATAEAEGLTFVKTPSGEGYKYVHFDGGKATPNARPYRVRIQSGKNGTPKATTLLKGVFATPEEAALEVARFYAQRPRQ